MRKRELVEIVEPVLDAISITFQARLHFGKVVVAIGCPFRLEVDGVVHHLDPESRTELGPLLGLYPATLAAAYLSEDAELHLEFDGGATLAVPPHPHYEAWQINDDRGWFLVCVAGTSGETAEWEPSP